MRRRIVIWACIPFVSVSMLLGCASTSTAERSAETEIFIGSSLPDTQIAIIKQTSMPLEFIAQFQEYAYVPSYGAPKKRFKEHGYVKELRMLPGHYLISLKCESAKAFALPDLDIIAKAGMTYEVGCRPDPLKFKAGAYIVKSYQTKKLF